MHLSKTGWSIFVYSLYLGSSGLMLAFCPAFVLPLLRQPPTNESWIRVFEFLAFLLALKGMFCAMRDQRSNMQLDVFTFLRDSTPAVLPYSSDCVSCRLCSAAILFGCLDDVSRSNTQPSMASP